MKLSVRQSEIITIARTQGHVMVEGLADYFQVTPQTIRKDLNVLCDARLLERTHGGAVHPSGIENTEYEQRRLFKAPQKQAIGQAAAAQIHAGASLIINIGTTTEAVADALSQHESLMVVTNNLNVANKLRGNPSVNVVIAGGSVRGSDAGIVGEATVDFMRQFKVDIAVIGTSAIDPDGDLLDYDLREVKVTRAIMANARRVILVTDSSKFERSAPVRVAHLSEVHCFVTDKCTSTSIKKLCQEHDIHLIETDNP